MLSSLFAKFTAKPRLMLRRPAWFGTLRRTTPLSSYWGFERGQPIDRYYIDRFFEKHRDDIRGRVLEVKDSGYTERYGGAVVRKDVLDIDPSNPQATIVADLATADQIPADTFDCFILTQTLQLIYDARAAVAHAHRILQPGGVLLVTVPMISRIVPQSGLQNDYWRFTIASCRRLFGEIFGAEQVTIYPYGNVLTSIAFLSGIAQEELLGDELDKKDEYFSTIIALRAVKHPLSSYHPLTLSEQPAGIDIRTKQQEGKNEHSPTP
jgi:SAM-dependent methyltransferase